MTEVSTIAYTKIVLHAVKYPHSAIRGFLLGKRQGQQNPPIVVDAIPALHGSLLNAPLEILLITLDTYCTEHKLQIVGIYFANDRLNDTSFDDIFAKTGERLHSVFPNPVILQVDNSKLSLVPKNICLKAFNYDSKTWKPSSCFLTNEETGLRTASRAIEEKVYREIVDFEVHLDDPSLDIFNAEITEKIRQLF
jgi:hypothetical protein